MFEVFTITILVLIYVLSFFYACKFFKIVYSTVGKWSSLNLEAGDLLFCILPIMNTLIAIDYFLGNCYRNPNNKS